MKKCAKTLPSCAILCEPWSCLGSACLILAGGCWVLFAGECVLALPGDCLALAKFFRPQCLVLFTPYIEPSWLLISPRACGSWFLPVPFECSGSKAIAHYSVWRKEK